MLHDSWINEPQIRVYYMTIQLFDFLVSRYEDISWNQEDKRQ